MKKKKFRYERNNLYHSKSPSQDELITLLENYQKGRFDEAENIAKKLTQNYPNYQLGWKVLGSACKQTGKLGESLIAHQRAVELLPKDAEANFNLGNALQEAGRLDDAISSYSKAIAIKPDYAEAHNNLGFTLQETNRLNDAIKSYSKAIAIKPEYVEVYYNLGNTLKELKRLDDAIASYSKAIAIRPEYAEAYNNLGVVFHENGRLDDAISSYSKAIAIKPEFAEAHNNLGVTLQESSRLEDAAVSFGKATTINPHYAEAHNNLGAVLQELGRLDDAEVCYRTAIAINPAKTEAHKNLGALLLELGKINDSSVCMSEALALKADFAPFKTAASVTALLPFGRSGSLFLHSLFDGHPEIATLPGVYLKGWFGSNCWQQLAPDIKRINWREDLVVKIVDTYMPLFNANNRQNIPGKPFGNTPWLSKASGFMELGPERSQPLVIDHNAFAATLLTMLHNYHSIDTKNCFELIHRAFEVAIRKNVGRGSQLDGNIFYHIHNPDPFELSHFLHHYPQARLLYLMRRPVQSLESWMLIDYPDDLDNISNGSNNYQTDRFWLTSWASMVSKVVNIFINLRLNANYWPNSRGVRLEDIKRNPKKIMPQLATWMGVSDHATLYESTFCGLQYWGPASKTTGKITGFDTKAIDQPAGRLFGPKDIIIFETLFWPISRLYGYTTDGEANFHQRLTEIRPLLDEPLEFESKMYSNLTDKSRKLNELPHYLRVHRLLQLMWGVLDRDGTYQNMVQPLELNLS